MRLEAALKYDELEIFLEELELSALYVDGNDLYVGGSSGLRLLDATTLEVKEVISTDLELVYSSTLYMGIDRLWIAHDHGVAYYKDGQLTQFSYPDVPKGRCNTIAYDHGEIVAGFETGMAIFHSDTIQHLTKKDGLAEDYVNTLAVDSFNQLWVGSYLQTKTGGLSILADNHTLLISTEDGLIHKFVTSILPLQDTGTLVGCGHLNKGGLTVFKYRDHVPYIFKNYTHTQGLPGPKIRNLYQDQHGYVWITSESDGLLVTTVENIFDSHSLDGLYLRTQQGLSNNEIKVIVENDTFLFLGGKVGLTRIRKRAFYPRLSK